MGRARYECDYCGKSFEDSADARRRHFSGRSHKTNVKLWFDSFQDQEKRAAAAASGGESSVQWTAVETQQPAPSAGVINVQQLPPSMIPPVPELFLHFRTDWG